MKLTEAQKIERDQALDKEFSGRPFDLRHAIKSARTHHNFGGSATCQKCRSALDYEVGSIRWGCSRRDLCPACWGTEAGIICAEAFGRSLREALSNNATRSAKEVGE